MSQYLGSIVANYAHIPDNITDPVQSLTIYISLFNKLGFVGIACVRDRAGDAAADEQAVGEPLRSGEQPHSAACCTQRGIQRALTRSPAVAPRTTGGSDHPLARMIAMPNRPAQRIGPASR